MELPTLKLDDLTIDVAIVQGGMGVGVSKSSLAGAVSKAGGLGVIASVGLGDPTKSETHYDETSRQALIDEIRKVKDRGLPVGVNIMVALSNYRSLIEACCEAGADVIISGGGVPVRLPQYATDSSVKLVPIISSAKAAMLVCRTWRNKYGRFPAAIVVEGPMAGGHLGFRFEELSEGSAPSLEDLVRDVMAVVMPFEQEKGESIPIIAAGGVYSGFDIARFLNIGAGGVQMGTRFVATHECDADDAYKQSYVNSSSSDVVVIQSPVGLPARVIKNGFVESIIQGEKNSFSCPYKCLLSCDARTAKYCIANALVNSSIGDMAHGVVMCGANVHRVNEIVSVKALVAELVADAEIDYVGAARNTAVQTAPAMA